jgi:hypothetical protein
MSKVYDPEVLQMMNDEFLRYRDDIYACDYTRRKVNLKHVPQFFLDHHRDYFNILNNQPFVYRKYIEWKKIPPFVPFLTLDVSPNWSDGQGVPNDKNVHLLRELMKLFGALSDRFSQIDYNIECGSNGDHLHAHAVLRLNPKMEKTVITQQQKGNLTRSLRKCWASVCDDEGMRGVLEGRYAVRFSLWRKPEFLQDKTDYLCEELKPLDHKNSVNLNLRETIVFTSKV